ncbi:hypothetical protein GCM10011514_04910 [Emticicia aquatilis]|uniref:Peptidase S74 domain-containing protein n=2 Tax=Emticicia aquatilis TaxID=1537369 RepID=A0A917DJQ6_9BACT|nr:hypothetical protein GCM10011514_04910 [Emticicia aquatilis]
MIAVGFEGFAQSVELRPSQGISVPQFTTAFIDALTNQPKGTVVFDKDLNVMKYWNGTAWISLKTGGVGWVENGINLENTNTGNVGIGLSNPSFKLEVNGDAKFSAPALSYNSLLGDYFGGSMTINNSTGDAAYTKLDGNKIQSFARNLLNSSPSKLVLNPFGGNVGIGTNFTPEYKLHLYSTGEQLIKVDGTNSLMIFNDRISNAQYGFLRAWTNNPFNPAGYYGLEIGVPPIVGGDPAKRLMFSTNYALRMVIMDDGKVGINNSTPAYNLDITGNAAIRGTSYFNHFNYGANQDTYIRGGKNGSNVIISDVEAGGKVGIGRYPTLYKLEVNGTMKANEVIVETGWADYVFDEKFRLKPLSEVARFINENKHLPDVPSAEEIQKNGVKLAELTTKMMQKIEELTLYVIEQNTEIEQLKKQVKTLK